MFGGWQWEGKICKGETNAPPSLWSFHSGVTHVSMKEYRHHACLFTCSKMPFELITLLTSSKLTARKQFAMKLPAFKAYVLLALNTLNGHMPLQCSWCNRIDYVCQCEATSSSALLKFYTVTSDMHNTSQSSMRIAQGWVFTMNQKLGVGALLWDYGSAKAGMKAWMNGPSTITGLD